MTIIVSLQKVISTATNLISIMERINLGHASSNELIFNKTFNLGTISAEGREETQNELVKVDNIANSSLIMSLCVILKNHLLNLYHLPEE